jgi:hypothetical protein
MKIGMGWPRDIRNVEDGSFLKEFLKVQKFEKGMANLIWRINSWTVVNAVRKEP